MDYTSNFINPFLSWIIESVICDVGIQIIFSVFPGPDLVCLSTASTFLSSTLFRRLPEIDSTGSWHWSLHFLGSSAHASSLHFEYCFDFAYAPSQKQEWGELLYFTIAQIQVKYIILSAGTPAHLLRHARDLKGCMLDVFCIICKWLSSASLLNTVYRTPSQGSWQGHMYWQQSKRFFSIRFIPVIIVLAHWKLPCPNHLRPHYLLSCCSIAVLNLDMEWKGWKRGNGKHYCVCPCVRVFT